METLEHKEERLHQLVNRLPPERLDLAETLLDQLQHEARVKVKEGKRIVRLGGLWKDMGMEIKEEDIGEGDGVESLSLTLLKIPVSSIRKLVLQTKDRKAHGAESIAERSNVKA